MGHESRFKKEYPKAKKLYSSIGFIDSPFFDTKIYFTTDGFHHLRYNESGSERRKQTQLLKMSLIATAKIILEKSGTSQEYRKQFGIVGRKKRDGSREMKEMEYWGFVAIADGYNKKKIHVRVIVRRIGNGKYHFWSVMPHSRLKNKDTYKLASETITDE